ncbi:hypothetical protein [Streptomyces antioxidans]|nr:hypothetical protein [Streptomyces antioxidans]
MADPQESAKAISEVLAHRANRGGEWRKMRRQVVLDLRAREPAVSYRKIAALLSWRNDTGPARSRPAPPLIREPPLAFGPEGAFRRAQPSSLG